MLQQIDRYINVKFGNFVIPIEQYPFLTNQQRNEIRMQIYELSVLYNELIDKVKKKKRVNRSLISLINEKLASFKNLTKILDKCGFESYKTSRDYVKLKKMYDCLNNIKTHEYFFSYDFRNYIYDVIYSNRPISVIRTILDNNNEIVDYYILLVQVGGAIGDIENQNAIIIVYEKHLTRKYILDSLNNIEPRGAFRINQTVMKRIKNAIKDPNVTHLDILNIIQEYIVVERIAEKKKKEDPGLPPGSLPGSLPGSPSISPPRTPSRTPSRSPLGSKHSLFSLTSSPFQHKFDSRGMDHEEILNKFDPRYNPPPRGGQNDIVTVHITKYDNEAYLEPDEDDGGEWKKTREPWLNWDNQYVKEHNNWFFWINQEKRINSYEYKRNNAYSEYYDEDHYKLFSEKIINPIIDELIVKYNNEYGGSFKEQKIIGNDNDKIMPNNVFVQKVTVNANNQVGIIGDIHSSFHSLLLILKELRNKNFFVGATMELKPDKRIIFLGDLVDRGPLSLEVLLLALTLKNLNFDKVYIIKGNHEDMITYHDYNNLSGEVNLQFGYKDYDEYFASKIHKIMTYFPSLILLNFGNNWYHLSHGAINKEYGISESGDSQMKIFMNSEKKIDNIGINDQTKRVSDLQWGDFDQLLDNDVPPSKGGRGTNFSPSTIKSYLDQNNIKCILSGHQDNTNIGLMRKEQHTGEITINNEQFNLESKITEGDYNLYVPVVLMVGEENDDDDDDGWVSDRSIVLKPYEDFIALVTSTATVPRELWYNTYLILSSQNPLQMRGGNIDYRHKYLKYKKKYLKYKNNLKYNKIR